MQELRLVAANERGTHLVLRSGVGDKFLVPIDSRLRAAVRGDRAHVGELNFETEGALRPREIQARIRAGASAEQVARASGVHLERVRRFEGPVLAEREYMAAQAGRAAVRRPGTADARPASLDDALLTRLETLGVAVSEVERDSWRREDGRWIVQLAYVCDEDAGVAAFIFDPRARTVVADNDQARWITGELAERPARGPFVPRLAELLTPLTSPAATAAVLATATATATATAARDVPASAAAPEPLRVPVPTSTRRVEGAITRRPVDVVARTPEPAGVAAAAPRPATVVTPPRPTPTVLPPAPPVRTTATVSISTVSAPARSGPGIAPAAGASEPQRPASPKPARRPATQTTTAPMDTPLPMTLPMTVPGVSGEIECIPTARTGTNDAHGDDFTAAGAPAPRTPSRNRRASVPAWDDIVFGTKRRE
ncbi:MAG: septation protein SepH [Sporichthyaceae bacterium]